MCATRVASPSSPARANRWLIRMADTNLRYWWRVEPDVLFSGSWASLIRFTDKHYADLLLPHLMSQEDEPRYPHWLRNRHLLRRTPRKEWVYSLVSVGRYSLRFMRMMTEKWASGVAGCERSAPRTKLGLTVPWLYLRSRHVHSSTESAACKRIHLHATLRS